MSEEHSIKVHAERPNPYVVVLLLLLAAGGIFSAFRGKAADEIAEGRVVEIISEATVTLDVGSGSDVVREQELRIEGRAADGTAQEYVVRNDFMPVKEEDTVFFRPSALDGSQYNVVDISRTRAIAPLAVFFILLVLLTSGRRGLYSLVGLMWSFAVIFSFMIPRILAGSSPIIVGVLGAAVILAPGLYLAYGFNRKSLAAFLGIVLALVFTGLLANYAVTAARFSGLSEASAYLSIEAASPINLIGLLIAGIIIAAVGVLDDVAAVQSSTVFALASVDPGLRGWRLFRKAMTVGKDHISAVVNTLVLAYTGAALPLLLLFSVRGVSPGYFVSIEIVAEEIVRTLVASSGLLLAVPLATAIAAAMAGRRTAVPKVGTVV